MINIEMKNLSSVDKLKLDKYMSKMYLRAQLLTLKKHKNEKIVQEYMILLENYPGLPEYVRYQIDRYYYDKTDLDYPTKESINSQNKFHLSLVSNIKVGDEVIVDFKNLVGNQNNLVLTKNFDNVVNTILVGVVDNIDLETRRVIVKYNSFTNECFLEDVVKLDSELINAYSLIVKE